MRIRISSDLVIALALLLTLPNADIFAAESDVRDQLSKVETLRDDLLKLSDNELQYRLGSTDSRVLNQISRSAFIDQHDFLSRWQDSVRDESLKEWRRRSQLIYELRQALTSSLNAEWLANYEAAKRRAGSRRVALAYDDKMLDASEKSRLAVVLISSTAEEQWPEAPVQTGVNLEEWLPMHFGFIGNENPQLREVLVQSTIAANSLDSPIVADSVIKVPPYPKESKDCFSAAWFDCVMRGFRPASREVDFDSGVPSPDEQNAQGIGTTTLVLSSGLSENPTISSGRDIPSKVLIYTDESPMADLRLLANPTESTILQNAVSPFTDAALATLQSISEEELNSRANRNPLWIIDWNFVDGHGAKVRSVVDDTIKRFGLKISSNNIQEIDLAPSKSTVAELRTMVNHYASSLRSSDQAEVERLRNSAISWIDKGEDKDTPGEPTQVHEFVVYSAIHKVLKGLRAEPSSNDHVFLNMSLEFESTAYKLFLERELWEFDGSDRFTLFAAAGIGKGWQALNPFVIPQSLSLSLRDVYNVAALHCDGQSGTASAPDANSRLRAPPVHLLAKGCGYDHGHIEPADYGSSFASPAVAATLWIRRLVHGSSAIDQQLLVNSTLPAVDHSLLHKSDTGGLFDPFLAVAPFGSVLINGRGAENVVDCEGSFDIVGEERIEFSTEATSNKAYTQVELAPVACEKGSARCLWVRFKNSEKDWDAFTRLPQVVGRFELTFLASNGDATSVTESNFAKELSYARCKIQ